MRHTIRRLMSLVCALALTMTLLPAPAAAAGGNQDSGARDMEKLTREEIVALLEQEESPSVAPFLQSPSVTAPYAAGQVSPELLQQGLDRLNALRRLAGVPAVTLDEELCTQTQYGAVLIAANNALSHTPPKPDGMDEAFYQTGYGATSSSNLSMFSWTSERPIALAVGNLMRDHTGSNLVSLGHRRWQLNPTMGKVGFGYARSAAGYSYVVEYAFDRSGPGCDYDFIAWPASGNFPSSIFDSSYPWSVTLDPERYATPDQAKLTVTLTRESDGKCWQFSGTGYNPSQQLYFNVNTSGYGVPNCITFRPDEVETYQGIYTVAVSGLRTTDGKVADLTYQVDFFDPETYADEDHEVQAPETFADVPADAWYASYVTQAAGAGLVKGVGEGRFAPMEMLNLGSVVALAARLHAEGGGTEVPAADGAWYQGAYDYCVEQGLFAPEEYPLAGMNANATRFQMVDLLDRAVSDGETATVKTVADGSIPDLALSHPYGPVVYRWYRAGIVEGDAAGRFNGESFISRAEMATILCRLAGLTPRG